MSILAWLLQRNLQPAQAWKLSNEKIWQVCPFEWRHELTEERLDEAIKIPIADATRCAS